MGVGDSAQRQKGWAGELLTFKMQRGVNSGKDGILGQGVLTYRRTGKCDAFSEVGFESWLCSWMGSGPRQKAWLLNPHLIARWGWKGQTQERWALCDRGGLGLLIALMMGEGHPQFMLLCPQFMLWVSSSHICLS